MKWDQQRPAKAAAERCQGRPRHPPRRGSVCSFLEDPPAGVQCRARPGGLRGGFPNPAKLICMGFAKNGLPCSRQARRPPRTPATRQERTGAFAPRRGTSAHLFFSAQGPLRRPLLRSPFSHIPPGRGAVPRTARRARRWISQSRETHLYAFCGKMGSRAHDRAEWPGGPSRPGGTPKHSPQGPCIAAGRGASAPSDLPYTYPTPPGRPTLYRPPPSRPTLHRPALHRPTLHAPQAACRLYRYAMAPEKEGYK
jgi:hypothetical protein